MSKFVTEVLRNQFDSSFKMTVNLVNVCPDDVWFKPYNDIPFWQQVYHFVYYMDYWFQDSYGKSESDFKTKIFHEKITCDLDKSINDVSVSKIEMRDYLKSIHEKTTRIFNKLDDKKLGMPIIEGMFTYADVIVGQIRHIMYNIGYLNGFLRQMKLDESDWYSYNEHDE